MRQQQVRSAGGSRARYAMCGAEIGVWLGQSATSLRKGSSLQVSHTSNHLFRTVCTPGARLLAFDFAVWVRAAMRGTDMAGATRDEEQAERSRGDDHGDDGGKIWAREGAQ
eukprot:240367-Rhodomonas_salina.1